MLGQRLFKIVSMSFLVLVFFIAFADTAKAGENLISNPGFESQGTNNLPVDWAKGGWGRSIIRYAYPVEGYNSGKAAKVEVKKYVNGDVKWFFKDVAVAPGEVYTFSDYYKSNVNSEINIRYLMTTGRYTYKWVDNIPASLTWKQYTKDIKIPAGAVSMTVFHLIKKVGHLTVDDYTLANKNTPPPPVTPTIKITSPQNGATVSATVELLAEVTNATGAEIQFYLDGALFGGRDTASPFSVTLDTVSIVNGNHTIDAKLYYGTGNTLDASQIIINVDNAVTPPPITPTIEITAPLNGATVSATVELMAEVTNATGVEVQFYLDGTEFGSRDTTSPFTATLDSVSIENGNHTISAKLYYGLGSTLDSGQIIIYVNNVVTPPVTPSIEITAPQNGATVSGIIDLSVAVTNATDAEVQFYLDGSEFGSRDIASPFTDILDTASIENGNHTIGARLYFDSGSSTLNATDIQVIVDNQVIPPPSNNLIQNPGFETSDVNNLPSLWYQGGWGNNTTNYIYPATGYASEKAAQVDVSSFTDGDAKWFFEDVPVLSGKSYTFSNVYKSDVDTSLNLRYLMADGTYRYDALSNLPIAPSWQTSSVCVFIPESVVSLTVFHLLEKVGSLTVDDYSLVEGCGDSFSEGMITLSFDDSSVSQHSTAFPILQAKNLKGTFYAVTDYVLDPFNTFAFHENEILELQNAGNEIAAHTRTHPHLTTLNQTEMQAEIGGSRTDLLTIGATPVSSFAYTYGEYDNVVIQEVKNAGFSSARSVEEGFNTKNTDTFQLKTMHVGSSISPEQVEVWINQAKAEKSWLILMFHEVVEGGDIYSTTPTKFQSMTDIIVNSGIKNVTIGEGASLLSL